MRMVIIICKKRNIFWYQLKSLRMWFKSSVCFISAINCLCMASGTQPQDEIAIQIFHRDEPRPGDKTPYKYPIHLPYHNIYDSSSFYSTEHWINVADLFLSSVLRKPPPELFHHCNLGPKPISADVIRSHPMISWPQMGYGQSPLKSR